MIVELRRQQSTTEESVPEWALVELNGELLPPNETPAEESHVELGSLSFDANGVPIMIVGTHEIKGKVEELKKQFVVLQKNDCSADDNDSEVQYEISGVVKKKILFNQYPKTIMKT